MKANSKVFSCLLAIAAAAAMLPLAATPARADFFDDARRTFQTDIPHFFTNNVPHFFQDDIPCAFGGHPTSGARKSCDSKPESGKGSGASEPPGTTDKGGDPPQTPAH